MALTLDHLATLPKRNKDHFISSFTQEQQHFFQQYLYEGQRVTQSWDHFEPMSPLIINPPASPKNDPQLGFGTPVLRARLDLVSTRTRCLNDTGRIQTAGGQESSKENERPSDHNAKLPDATKYGKLKEELQKKNFSRADKKRSKEHNLCSGSDNESVRRRADRRQRKKTKRDIMDPEFSGDNKDDKPSNTCKIRKQAKRQSKLRQEFALMHGFSSTNVGKNRLTFNPGRRDIGVFQKGKASGKMDVVQVGKRKRQESDFLFSETTFLNKPRQKVSKIDFQNVVKISASREEGSTVASSASVPRSSRARTDSDVKVRSRKFKDSKAPSKSNLVSKTKTQNEDKVQSGYNPADSIVWNIEQAELLGSEVSSGVMPRSIVLEIDHLPLISNEVLGNEDTNATLETHLKSSQQKSLSVSQSDILSSPSLGPSQSASQTGFKTVDMVSLPTVPSKYFKYLPSILAEPHYTINQLGTKPSALSKLGELSIIEDTIPQMPEPTSHLHSAGPSSRSYCDDQEGRPDLVPSMEPNYDLEVSLYCEGYPDSEFWSPVDHPGDLDVGRLDDTNNIVDHANVDFNGHTNSCVDISADDEIWTLDYVAGEEHGEKDHTSFIPLSGHQYTELHNSIPPSIWQSDAYSGISERCQGVVYQDSGGDRLSIDLGSEDQQMQSDGDLNLEHERVSSTDLELYPDVVHHFWQGYSLLYGLNTPGDSSSLHKLSNVEADVARELQLNHWQPQKL